MAVKDKNMFNLIGLAVGLFCLLVIFLLCDLYNITCLVNVISQGPTAEGRKIGKSKSSNVE